MPTHKGMKQQEECEKNRKRNMCGTLREYVHIANRNEIMILLGLTWWWDRNETERFPHLKRRFWKTEVALGVSYHNSIVTWWINGVWKNVFAIYPRDVLISHLGLLEES
ncbi:CLUMA_CG006367, isoform A [Clunio marinus]|uniref:CLUMA_CG006367, isoform A n=1 Tax=Clunio marinus TaxID=568069 RepID=A0A1J1HXQ8_9DIPT|nr:CLUMA_CG006367, isoform A [Clunio marinus]